MKIKEFLKNINWKKSFINVCLLFLGTLIFTSGCAFFLIPFKIVSGGISGISVLTSAVISPDIMSYILSWGLFAVGLIVLGPKFTMSSFVSTLFYPIFLSIFIRTGAIDYFVNAAIGNSNAIIVDGVITNLAELNLDYGFYLIIGIIGGILVGIGCAITFWGGGSTGGLDILTFIISKYTGIKESVPFFVIDAVIIIAGMIMNFVIPSGTTLIYSFIGIITAIISSALIEVVYSGVGAYSVDVISDKYEEIINFAINDVDRDATLFDVIGGYSKESKKMVRINFSRREYTKIKNGISQIDAKAFCTFSQVMFIGGEGFSSIEGNNPSSITLIKKYLKKKKNGK